MKKEQKAQVIIDELAAQLGEAQSAIYAVDYRGISVPQAAELRPACGSTTPASGW